ncbi:hypothetical protein BYT27DRAFT_7205841 [Phlegmacium glaucopus]|nr:hypothetical protein BYT27DRAFT_7205841 [Phlegmacium glaucopus]
MDPNDTNSQLQAWPLFVMEQIMSSQGSTMPNTPTQQSVGPVMGQHHQPPPSCNNHSARRRTGDRYPNNVIPGSSGTTTSGQSIKDTGVGWAQRPLSCNPSMLDRNPAIQQKQRKPYNRDRSGPSPRRIRTDEVPVVEWQSMLISQSIHYILSTIPYRKRNSKWFECPCCSPTGTIDLVDIGTINVVDISTIDFTVDIGEIWAISIATCRANGSSCPSYVGLDRHS